MTLARFAKGALAALLLLAASPALAQEDDDECGGILTALSKTADDLMKSQVTSPPAVCAGMGQVLGLARAGREVADQCMEEGAKRDKAMKDMEELVSTYEGALKEQCK